MLPRYCIHRPFKYTFKPAPLVPKENDPSCAVKIKICQTEKSANKTKIVSKTAEQKKTRTMIFYVQNPENNEDKKEPY